MEFLSCLKTVPADKLPLDEIEETWAVVLSPSLITG